MVDGALNRVCMVGLLAAFLFQVLPAPTLDAALSPANSQAPSSKRWVTFDLVNPDASGEIPFGQPLELSMSLGGMSQVQTPLIAICESVLFERQLVLLEPDPESMVMKGTANLEPIPHGKLSVPPKVARIQVTFARSQKDKLERVMTRIVYVTLGEQIPVSDTKEPALPATGELSGNTEVQEEVQPDVKPMSAAPMSEEDLLPLPSPGQGTAYWQEVSALVSRSWSRAARRVRHSPSSETVRVRFRLYPSGRAQLIEIEKGSGAREIDEAGIYAVVHAQPFPPFPEDVGTEPVDVHVRMRTGAKAMLQESPSSKSQPGSASNSGAAIQTK
jgi:TonB family protein